MRNARFTGWGAAALAAVLVTTAAPAVALPLDESASPAPVESAAPEQTSTPEPTASASATEAPEPVASETPTDDAAPLTKRAERSERAVVAAAATGDLTVTGFYDNFADGLYDPSKVAPNGSVDGPFASAPRVKLADGTFRNSTSPVAGQFVFADLPLGPAEVHFEDPNFNQTVGFFDATGATSAAGIERLDLGNFQGGATGFTTVNVDEDGEALLVGMASAKAAVAVKNPDGSIATGLTGIEFGSAGDWFAATEYLGLPGSYEALNGSNGVSHLPDRIGMRMKAPAGYALDTVTAVDSISGQVLALAEADGAWWIQTTDLAASFSRADFTVTLEELPKGDLTVTRFDDRYADGIFDTTKTARDGNTDEKRTSGYAYLQASDGSWYGANAGASGDFAFRDIPLGEAKVYLGDPNSYVSVVFFDATDATTADDIERLPSRRISFANGTFQNADGSTGVISGPSGTPQGEAKVTIDENGEDLLVGMTALRAVAAVEYEDGAPASGVSVELGSGGEWYPATEYDFPSGIGSYEAMNADGTVRHLPDELGLRVDPPAGYEVGDVIAADGVEIDVTERDGAYWIDTVDASSYFSNPTFEVTLEELPTASVEVTYFADVELDGTYQADADTLVEGAEVYLQDAAGEWWATTSGEGGGYTFSGVAPGAAKIYARIPEIPDGTVIPQLPELELPDALLSLWDATDVESYRDTVRAETDTISFEGTLINPDGTTSPITVYDAFVGVIDADLAEPQAEARAASQQVLIGGAFVFQTAAVVGATGEPVEGVEVEFLSNEERIEGEELVDGLGAFAATDDDGALAVFGAAEYGIAPTVPEGYEVTAVTAISLLDETVLDVTGGPAAITVPDGLSLRAAGDEYRVDPTQLAGPGNAVVWAVVVAPTELPPVDPGTLPGTDVDPGAGLPAAGPAAAPRVLPATGSDMDPLVWMLGAGLLIAAGLSTRVLVRRRNS